MNAAQSTLDRLAITTSSLCALHCVALPLLTALFPSLLSTFVADHHFHQLLVWAVIPSSIVALFLGCRRHKNSRVFGLGLVGLAVLVIVAFWGHDLVGETGEKVGTVLGSLVIVAAHIRNFTLCRQASCEH